jgi:hypothetical protein
MNALPEATSGARLSVEDAATLAVEAYIYLYPLLTMEVTRRQMTNLPAGQKPGFGPVGDFVHFRAFPPAEFKAVVRPNFDTLYSVAWLDLTAEPMVVSVPDTAGRYYLLPMYDMWTDAFAVPGRRTSGTEAAAYALTPPGWSASVPAGVRSIAAPTRYVWIIGRTQTNGPSDYEAVNALQDGYTVTPLSRWEDGTHQPVEPQIDESVDMETAPLDQVNSMSAADYFSNAAELMRIHPPHATDWSTLARLERIGLRPGERFDLDTLGPGYRVCDQRLASAGADADEAGTSNDGSRGQRLADEHRLDGRVRQLLPQARDRGDDRARCEPASGRHLPPKRR